TGSERISYGLWDCFWFWNPSLCDPGTILQTSYSHVSGRRGNGPCYEHRYVLYAVYWIFLQLYRSEDDYIWSFKRCRRYEGVYHWQHGESLHPGSGGGNYGPQIRYCFCVVCGSYGMAGKLSHIFCQVPDRKVENNRKRIENNGAEDKNTAGKF